MPSDTIHKWLKSSRYAQIETFELKPKRHPAMRNNPLSVMRGQSEVFFLEDRVRQNRVIKKFYANKLPCQSYLQAVRGLLPQGKEFASGNGRLLLNNRSLTKINGSYHTKELAHFLDGAILMPQIEGSDLYRLFEKVRNSQIKLSFEQRISICSNLIKAIKKLEQCGISHRDISGSNVYADCRNFNISLIDFDSMFHSSLKISHLTTLGSEGYIAPFLTRQNSRISFCERADRFALAILCTELLIIDKNLPQYHEGGLFAQSEIYNRSGKSINFVRSQLRNYPDVLTLFEKVLSAKSFENCPSPDSWLNVLPTYRSVVIYSLPNLVPALIKKRQKVLLNTLELPKLNTYPTIELPPDPWKKVSNTVKKSRKRIATVKPQKIRGGFMSSLRNLFGLTTN